MSEEGPRPWRLRGHGCSSCGDGLPSSAGHVGAIWHDDMVAARLFSEQNAKLRKSAHEAFLARRAAVPPVEDGFASISLDALHKMQRLKHVEPGELRVESRAENDQERHPSEDFTRGNSEDLSRKLAKVCASHV